jgi:integrase/recombinase XerC
LPAPRWGGCAPVHPPEAALAPPLQAFLQHLAVERRLAERTRAMYAQALAWLEASAAAEGVALEQAQPHHLRGWTAQLRHRGLGPRSIAIALAAWRGLYRWWGRQGVVAANPVQGLKAPKAPRPLPKALSVEQAVALAEQPPAARRPALAARDHAIVELLYGCGLRVGELLALDVGPGGSGWIDGLSGPGSAAEVTAHVLGKGSKRRSVPVGAAAVAALRGWLAERAAVAKPGEAALFVSQRGTRLAPSQLRTRLKALAQQAGLAQHVDPHMLRHSYASHLLQSSGDLRAVQELLGHASIASTQVYTRLDFQHLARAYDAAHPRAKRRDAGAAPAAAPAASLAPSPLSVEPGESR